MLALKAWLEAAKIKTGPVFRRVDRYGFVSRTRGLDPASVAYIVKQAARRAGFRHVGEVSGHSFRSGHVSQAVRNGVPEYVVMKQSQVEGGSERIYKDGRAVRPEPGGRSLGGVEEQIPRRKVRDFVSFR